MKAFAQREYLRIFLSQWHGIPSRLSRSDFIIHLLISVKLLYRTQMFVLKTKTNKSRSERNLACERALKFLTHLKSSANSLDLARSDSLRNGIFYNVDKHKNSCQIKRMPLKS